MGMGQICTRVKNNKQFIEKKTKKKNKLSYRPRIRVRGNSGSEQKKQLIKKI